MDATPPEVAPGAHAPLRDTKGLSEHVVYEINRFFETHGMLVRGEVESGTVLHDAVLESFALHLRNLVEFFFDKVKWPDNARAEHFFSDPAVWHELRGGDNYLTAAQTQGHKQITHLTYDRIGADKRWFVGDLAEKVHGVVRTFLDNAEEARMGPELIELKKTFRK